MENNQTNNPIAFEPNVQGKDKQIVTENKELHPQFEDLSNPEIIKKHIQEIQKEVKEEKQKNELLALKKASEWIEVAKTQTIPKMLFSEFWHEGELCILFADSNLGKSILAVQIANSISKGEHIVGFQLDAPKQSVIYFDFELSAKQFEARYSEKNMNEDKFTNHYQFEDNFYRVELNPDSEIDITVGYEKILYKSIESTVLETKSKILIVDNITYLRNETEKSKEALALMKILKKLKTKYQLSILALAHTTKRDLSKPLNQNDLQGSKMIFNFIDSCFAIGQSISGAEIRFIKQIKSRNTAIIYHSNNVAVCQISKISNFLSFEFIEYNIEREHLKNQDDAKQELENTIIQLRNDNPTLSFGKIAEQTGTNKMKVKRTLDKINMDEIPF